MSKEYLEAQFRRYFPDASDIQVSMDEVQEVWTVIIKAFDDYENPREPDQVWTFEVSSEDERFVFIRKQDVPDMDHFTDIITIPFEPEPVEPVWRSSIFTEEERNDMVLSMEEEVQGSVGEYAADLLDDCDLIDLLCYVNDDTSEVVDMLQAILDSNAGMDDYESGEHESHVTQAAFMKRFGLVDSVGDVTPLGRKFMQAYK